MSTRCARFFFLFSAIFSKILRVNRFFLSEKQDLTVAARLAQKKSEEERGAEQACNDADRQNARKENDSRERVATGEEERAEEKRRRD
jgi:hypothetical protein